MKPLPPNTLPVIGVVGGIGSGKSAVARSFANLRNFVRIDADSIGHHVLEHASIKQQLQKRFGPEVFDQSGNVDRSRLAARVFGTGESSESALEELNRIVHPAIHREIRDQIENAQIKYQTSPTALQGVILDAAILLETGWGDDCHFIAFVETPDEIRRQRVIETRGWTPEQWKQRESSQLSLQAKKEAADVIVDNSKDLETAVTQLDQFLAEQLAS